MVHDTTGLDNWHHDIVNHLSKASGFYSLSENLIEEGNYTEALVLMKKARSSQGCVLAMLKEDYWERKRNGE